MKKNAFLLILFVFQGFAAFSQLSVNLPGDLLQNLKAYHNSRSSVNIYLDSLIEQNYYRHILYNQKDPGVTGYRIRIFRDSGINARDRATAVYSNFMTKFDGVDAEMKYVENTDWVIYVGNCRTRSEVLKLFNRVKVDFPYSFIVSQRISVSDE